MSADRKKRRTGSPGLRSAYELAVDRLGGDTADRGLSEEQRAKIAEIDREYTARIAEREVLLDSKLAAAGDEPERVAEVRDEHARDVARLRERMEREKERARRRRADA
jgi:hypothetical protein